MLCKKSATSGSGLREEEISEDIESNCKLQIANFQLQIGEERGERDEHPRSALFNLQLEICNLQFAIASVFNFFRIQSDIRIAAPARR
jgi:hypothetical protein